MAEDCINAMLWLHISITSFSFANLGRDVNENLAVTVFWVNQSMYSILSLDHLPSPPLLSNGNVSFCLTICIYNKNSTPKPNQKKKVKKQKLHYDAFVVQTARNLIHLLEAEESYVNSKLSNTDTTAAAEYNG